MSPHTSCHRFCRLTPHRRLARPPCCARRCATRACAWRPPSCCAARRGARSCQGWTRRTSALKPASAVARNRTASAIRRLQRANKWLQFRDFFGSSQTALSVRLRRFDTRWSSESHRAASIVSIGKESGLTGGGGGAGAEAALAAAASSAFSTSTTSPPSAANSSSTLILGCSEPTASSVQR